MARPSFAPSSTRCWRTARRASSPIPIPTIARAIRAYEKAGFEKAGMVDTPDGPALLMVRNAMTARTEACPSPTAFRHGTWLLIAAGIARAAGRDPLRDGPPADLRLRLRQALARRGAEFGELAAHRRLVHVLAHHPRLPVLWRDLSAVSARSPGRRA